MSAKITIQGTQYKVAEDLGFNHSIGMYAKMVFTGDGRKMAVRPARGAWRFSTSGDRLSAVRTRRDSKNG